MIRESSAQAVLELAEHAARRAGRLLQDSFRQNAGVRSRTGKDIKTEADLQAEACILKVLDPSGWPIIAEETSVEERPPEGRHWLVDPLDGTMNFTRGFPMHSVSIGLWNGQTPEVGVVFDLPRGQLTRGCVGVGAWCDDRPIRVSTVEERSQAVLATGFPTHRDYSDEAVRGFVGRVQSFKKIRMIGSAALSLSWVARGVFDAYIEEEIMLWDVAAGLALVLAAGGAIEVHPGRKPWGVTAAATNGLVAV